MAAKRLEVWVHGTRFELELVRKLAKAKLCPKTMSLPGLRVIGRDRMSFYWKISGGGQRDTALTLAQARKRIKRLGLQVLGGQNELA